MDRLVSIPGSGIQVRILSSAGKARAAQNPYLFRTNRSLKGFWVDHAEENSLRH